MAINFYAIITGSSINDLISIDISENHIDFVSEVKGLSSLSSTTSRQTFTNTTVGEAGYPVISSASNTTQLYGIGENSVVGVYNTRTKYFKRVDAVNWGINERSPAYPVKLGNDYYFFGLESDSLVKFSEKTGCVITTGSPRHGNTTYGSGINWAGVINNTIYAIFGASGRGSSLAEIDTDTGNLSIIGTERINWNNRTAVVVGNTLYAIETAITYRLGVVSLTDGQLTPIVGGDNLGTTYSNLLVGGSNVIYGLNAADDKLVSISTSTGVLSEIGPDDYGINVTDLVSPKMVGSDIVAFSLILDQFVRVDTSNGQGQTIGARQLGRVLTPSAAYIVEA